MAIMAPNRHIQILPPRGRLKWVRLNVTVKRYWWRNSQKSLDTFDKQPIANHSDLHSQFFNLNQPPHHHIKTNTINIHTIVVHTYIQTYTLYTHTYINTSCSLACHQTNNQDCWFVYKTNESSLILVDWLSIYSFELLAFSVGQRSQASAATHKSYKTQSQSIHKSELTQQSVYSKKNATEPNQSRQAQPHPVTNQPSTRSFKTENKPFRTAHTPK